MREPVHNDPIPEFAKVIGGFFLIHAKTHQESSGSAYLLDSIDHLEDEVIHDIRQNLTH